MKFFTAPHFIVLATIALTPTLRASQARSSSALSTSSSLSAQSSTLQFTTTKKETSASQFVRSMHHLYGIGTHRNLTKAFTYLQIAADNGHHAAQATMCNLFQKGIFVSKDAKLADVYFKKLSVTLKNQGVREFLNSCIEYKKFIQPTTPINCCGSCCFECARTKGAEPLFERGDIVVQLPCKHSICHTCFEQLLEGRAEGQLPRCPDCNHEFKTDHITSSLV